MKVKHSIAMIAVSSLVAGAAMASDVSVSIKNNTDANQVIDATASSTSHIERNPTSVAQHGTAQLVYDGGSAFFPANITVKIGDSANPAGQCILAGRRAGVAVRQAGNGSDGFHCHGSGTSITLDKNA